MAGSFESWERTVGRGLGYDEILGRAAWFKARENAKRRSMARARGFRQAPRP